MDAPLALREFLEYVVGSLIEHRDLASISQHQEGNRVSFDVLLHKDDVGLIIGRNGHTVKALRSLMTAAATREGIRISLRVEPRDEEKTAPGAE
ncbi:MAG: KH domain-containing protein [Verrucomicrobiales bacterium]